MYRVIIFVNNFFFMIFNILDINTYSLISLVNVSMIFITELLIHEF